MGDEVDAKLAILQHEKKRIYPHLYYVYKLIVANFNLKHRKPTPQTNVVEEANKAIDAIVPLTPPEKGKREPVSFFPILLINKK